MTRISLFLPVFWLLAASMCDRPTPTSSPRLSVSSESSSRNVPVVNLTVEDFADRVVVRFAHPVEIEERVTARRSSRMTSATIPAGETSVTIPLRKLSSPDPVTGIWLERSGCCARSNAVWSKAEEPVDSPGRHRPVGHPISEAGEAVWP